MRERIINFHAWSQSDPGRYALEWEQAQCDEVVADVFGYHSLQLGWACLDGLRANRMAHRWLALGEQERPLPEHGRFPGEGGAWHRLALYAEPLALPLAAQTLDLLVLPHALEASPDPHAVLREAERVLVPEGRVLITGFNPLSLWGVHAWRTALCARWGRGHPYLPQDLGFVGYRRLRDWLHLLNFEVESARFGCHVPTVRSPAWLERWRWMDALGQRWWPILGAVYMVVAVKRVQGVRLLGPGWRAQPAKRPAMAMPAARGQRPVSPTSSAAVQRPFSPFSKDGSIEPG